MFGKKLLAVAAIGSAAFFGLAAPAFASTSTDPIPTVTTTPTTPPPCSQCDDHHGDHDGNWNKDRDDHGSWSWDRCSTWRPGVTLTDQRFPVSDWQRFPRGVCDVKFPWGWNFGHRHHHHQQHCTTQLLTFNFAHGSHIITETFGPALHVNSVVTYQGQTYTVVWTDSHGHFSVKDVNGHLVTNWGKTICRGEAHLVTCTCTRR